MTWTCPILKTWHDKSTASDSLGGNYITPEEVAQLTATYLQEGMLNAVCELYYDIPDAGGAYFDPEAWKWHEISTMRLQNIAVHEAMKRSPFTTLTNEEINNSNIEIGRHTILIGTLGSGGQLYEDVHTFSYPTTGLIVKCSVRETFSKDPKQKYLLTVAAYKDGKYINLDEESRRQLLDRLRTEAENHNRTATSGQDVYEIPDNAILINKSEIPLDSKDTKLWNRVARFWQEPQSKAFLLRDEVIEKFNKVLNEYNERGLSLTEEEADDYRNRLRILLEGLPSSYEDRFKEIDDKRTATLRAPLRFQEIIGYLRDLRSVEDVQRVIREAQGLKEQYPHLITQPIPPPKEVCLMAHSNSMGNLNGRELLEGQSVSNLVELAKEAGLDPTKTKEAALDKILQYLEELIQASSTRVSHLDHYSEIVSRVEHLDPEFISSLRQHPKAEALRQKIDDLIEQLSIEHKGERFPGERGHLVPIIECLRKLRETLAKENS